MNRASARRADLWLLVLLLLVAFFLRVYRLDQVPPGMNGDEWFKVGDALSLGPGRWQVYFEGNNGHEALYVYLLAASLRLLGQNLLAVRLPAALLGTGTVLLAYAIGRQAFSRAVGLLASALITVSLWPWMHARWGLRAITLTFMSALTVYLYCRAIRHRPQSLIAWTAAGLALGLTMYTYVPSRLFPLVIVVWLALVTLFHREVANRQWRRWLFSLTVGLAVFAPYGRYMLENPDKVNRRINDLGGMGLLRAANWERWLDTAASVPLSFLIRGDTAARYNVPGRPVFDPLTGAIFAIGVGLVLWRAFRGRQSGRRWAYGLLPVWAGAMLVPNALLGYDTSSLRSVGAVVPVYLMVAIGFEALYRWAVGRRPERARQGRATFAILAAAGVGVTLLVNWHHYFRVWANHPGAREAFQAHLAEAGRYLEAHPPPPGVRVYVVSNYVTDSAPQIFAFSTDEAVTWIDHQTTFAWQPGGGEAWYLELANKPLAPAAAERLAGAAAESHHFENGDPAFTLYRLAGSDVAWEPAWPYRQEFAGGPRITGYDLPETLRRGEPAAVTLHWEVPAGLPELPNRLTYASVELRDAGGNSWAAAEGLLGYPQAGWRAGDRFVQLVTLNVPEGMPPGPAWLVLSLRDGEAGPYAADAPAEPAGPVLVRGGPAAVVEAPADSPVFGGVLALAGRRFSTEVAPGLTVNIALDWLALARPPADYRLRLQLVRPGEAALLAGQTFELWPGTYPPTQWPAGEQVTTLHQLAVPADIAAGPNPILVADLLDRDGRLLAVTQGDNRLAEMTLVMREHHYETPAIEHPFEASFGDGIRLLGYDLDEGAARPGGTLTLTLYWQALATPADHYTVFNHLVAADGRFGGQLDGPPSGDAWLTGSWLPGEIITDRRAIPIRAEASSGRYALVIGLYSAGSGERLPVAIQGEAQARDELLLTEVEVGS